MLTVHGFRPSGNCYKVQLLLELLGVGYRWVDVDSTAGGTRTPEFLAKNPDGRVPVLELDDGRFLPESNAILCYLADGTSFLPADRFERGPSDGRPMPTPVAPLPCHAASLLSRTGVPDVFNNFF